MYNSAPPNYISLLYPSVLYLICVDFNQLEMIEKRLVRF